MKPYPIYLMDRWIIPRIAHLTIYTFTTWDHWTVLLDVGIEHRGKWAGRTIKLRFRRPHA